MSTEVKRRRGTALEHETFTGANAEITVNSTNNSLHVHDAVTVGGHEISNDTTNNGKFKNKNELSNPQCKQLNPDVPPPGATPQDYVAGDEVYLGVIAKTPIEGLTDIGGLKNATSGILTWSVPNSGAIADLSAFSVSRAGLDLKPNQTGITYTLVGDNYEVDLDFSVAADVFSVKFETGAVATGHEVSPSFDKSYNSVQDMLSGNPVGASVGDKCSTGYMTWRKVSDSIGDISDFVALTDYDVIDFGCVYDCDFANQTGTDNTDAIQACFDASTEYTTIRLISNTGLPAFTDQVVYPGHRTYYFGQNRSGGLILKPSATGRAVMVADRWFNSSEPEGRPVTFVNAFIHGNRIDPDNAANGQHGIITCNFRPIFIDPYITQCAGDGVHGPNTLRDATPVTFQAVGMRLVRPRIWNCTGDLINLNNEAYSDGWMTEPSLAQAGNRAVHIVKGSGWFITKAHSDTIQGELLVIDTASNFELDGWYLEAYNNANDGRAAFSIGGILSDGIKIGNIQGQSGPSRTGKFFNFFTSNNTNPSITIDNVNVDFEDVTAQNIEFCGVSTGSVSPTKLTVTNVSKAPDKIYSFSGTQNVTVYDSNNAWNWHKGNFEDYNHAPGYDCRVYNTDYPSNIESWRVGPTGQLISLEYKMLSKTSSSANYDEVFPVGVLLQQAVSFKLVISSHQFYSGSNTGQWIGEFVVSQNLLTDTPATVTIELYSATGTLTAPTVTLESVGSTNNNDYQIRVTGSNSNSNARTTVIFSA